MSVNTVTRIIGALVAIGAAISISLYRATTLAPLPLPVPWVIAIIATVSAIAAFIITPYITVIPFQWISNKIRAASASDLVAAAIGLAIGLILAVLLAIPLQYLPFGLGQITPFLGAVIFGYIGLTTAVLRKSDIAHLFQSTVARRRERDRDRDEDRERSERSERGKKREPEKEPIVVSTIPSLQILLDTSTIIDGRIADISQTGFIIGTLVVPRFVLNELQRIADSADTMRRNRGRRGLEILNRLQKDATVPIEIVDTDVEGIADVDGKLVKVARDQHCPIITNDFNLNRVAELQGVKVLNINELANAIKPVLLPGEDIHIKIMQDGKELGQGVGYLDDGTMIVVENGRQFMNMMIEVTVTRVLQTVAGRMIFAHPKQANASSAAIAPQSSLKQRQA
ncbi:PIN/TRAM domain-containing protein [Dictyobacter formicarum]|uniref:PIN/TRAM domain-containing protein n=1 Tax=Dictyobacter formicarum TaxID=2778368 RepID=A0ABQ3VBA2_9CHLR|nr:PIN domain-containing protein [Dictyobacter formicarum]GHO83070.1 PIN/TRAM domain-containing protein [Dictyobacter formicarum]